MRVFFLIPSKVRSFLHVGSQRTVFDQCYCASVKLQDKTCSWKAIGILCFVLGNKHQPLLCHFNTAFNNLCTPKYIWSNLMYVNQVFMSCDRLLLMAGIYLLHQAFFDRLLLWEDGAELCGHGKPSTWPEEFERPWTLCPWCFPCLSHWSVAIFMPVSVETSFSIT